MTETTAQASGSLKGESTVEEPDRSARAIGRRAAEIRATVPDLELGRDVDATPRRHSCAPARRR